MSDPAAAFVLACRSGANGAASNGFPVFGRGLGKETPLNSSPYLLDMPTFRSELGWSGRRDFILERLKRSLRTASDAGIRFELLLAAGSFLTQKPDPTDLDCLGFYSLAPGVSPDVVPEWRATLASEPLDLKVCPLDVGPLVLLKRGIFFSNLFAYDRHENALVRGGVLVMVDADASGIDA